jgi:hypothetical protein
VEYRLPSKVYCQGWAITAPLIRNGYFERRPNLRAAICLAGEARVNNDARVTGKSRKRSPRAAKRREQASLTGGQVLAAPLIAE